MKQRFLNARVQTAAMFSSLPPPLVQIDHLPEQDPEQESAPEGAQSEAPAGDPAFTSAGDFSSSDTLSTQLSDSDLPPDQDWSDSLSPDLAPEEEPEPADSTTGSAGPAAPQAPAALPSSADSFSDTDHPDEGGTEQPSHPTPDSPTTVFSSRFPLLLLGLIVAGYAGLTFIASSYIEQTATRCSPICRCSAPYSTPSARPHGILP